MAASLSSSLRIYMLIPVVAVFIATAALGMAANQSILIASIAGLVAGAITAIVLASVYVKDLLKSIKAATRLAENAAQGNKGQPIDIHRNDEIGQLINALNKMVGSDEAAQQANEDPLTGLANRRLLTQRLEQEMKKKSKLCMMFIDLDGFKPINDEFGHDVGDIALKMVADRYGACVRESDVLCRLGGDEFVIMFVGMHDREVIEERAKKVLEMTNEPFWIEGNRLRMGASIGISVAPEDGEDAETILNAADESMYAAKQGGKNAYRFYS